MERSLTAELIRWKQSQKRKPLILEGARQVGKTYLLKDFGKNNYKNVVYVNFDNLDPDVTELFTGALNPQRIIEFLSIKYSTVIEPGSTLIIFDEIQELPRALNSLKYFTEDAPEYHVATAGSLLGTSLHQQTPFPVGKVDFLKLEPLTLEEFTWAVGETEKLRYVKEDPFNTTGFTNDLIHIFKQYSIVGGMPEAVLTWVETKDINAVDTVLRNLLNAYENDFSKYPDNTQAQRIRNIWQSIPSQFAKESKRFVYGVAKEGARAREYELSINWLESAGLVRKIHAVTRGDELPLSAYKDLKNFKLYLLDIGLARIMAGLPSGEFAGSTDIFSQFNGLFAEQFVLQQLSTDYTLYYWTSGAQSEVGFVAQIAGKIIPIEVKSGDSVKAKSLAVYRKKYNPPFALRASMKPFENNNNLINIPLYALWALERVLPQ